LGGTSGAAGSALRGSSVLLAVSACCLVVVWLTEVLGDPTDGVAFYTFGFAAAVLGGVALVIAAWSRRDVFGTSGLVGAFVILVTSLTGFFPAVVVGAVVVAAAVARRRPRLLPGLLLLALGSVGMLVRADMSDDAYIIFVPVLAVASAVLAATLRQV
jgi:hypothetical protein